MRVVFADSGYWIALLDNRDALHAHALAFSGELIVDHLVTTHMVVVEVLNFASNSGAYMRQRAGEWAKSLRVKPNVEVVWHTEEQFWAAVERYEARQDQTWSLTDCASFLVMEERNITEALAYDRDFEQAGFVALLRGGLE